MITIEDLQKYMGIENYFDLYKWLVRQGYDKDEKVELVYSKNKPVYLESTKSPIDQKVRVVMEVRDIKAAAFDEVFRRLPDVGRVQAFRAAYLTSADPAHIFKNFLNTIPVR